MAPFPEFETSELPTMFVAVIFAKMLDPQGNKNGEAYSVAIGMVQVVIVIIDALAPLQLFNSVTKVTPSTCLIVIV